MPTKDESHTNIVDTSSATAPRNKWLSRLVILVRILVGCTFIFSGIVKLIDPMGTMYKIEDYMQAFGMSLFGPAAYYAAVFLSIIEFVLGFNALLGSYLRKTPLFLLIFMAIMTPLTLYLAIANPIPDCGCFGDAITLSNWATFIKNVILLTLVIFLVQFNTRTRSVFHREIQAFIVTWVVIFGLALVYYAHAYSPILDFRPYKVGTDLAAAYFGDDEAMVEYDFVYERDVNKRYSV
ncbi:MAG: DoxX family protein [Bacteroidaceae bacterium]|nr:DoxX family protein [Bacteroidaceae bacterium]